MRVAKCEVKENYESKKIKLSTPQKPENEHDKHHIVGCFQQWPIAEFSGIRRGGITYGLVFDVKTTKA